MSFGSAGQANFLRKFKVSHCVWHRGISVVFEHCVAFDKHFSHDGDDGEPAGFAFGDEATVGVGEAGTGVQGARFGHFRQKDGGGRGADARHGLQWPGLGSGVAAGGDGGVECDLDGGNSGADLVDALRGRGANLAQNGLGLALALIGAQADHHLATRQKPAGGLSQPGGQIRKAAGSFPTWPCMTRAHSGQIAKIEPVRRPVATGKTSVHEGDVLTCPRPRQSGWPTNVQIWGLPKWRGMALTTI